MWILLTVAGALIGLVGAAIAYVVVCFRWQTRETGDDRYFGRTAAERRALREEIQRRSRLFLFVFVPLARLSRRGMPVTEYRGVTAPGPACPRPAFREATRYQPTPDDVFVATQMKCGTTWMQQIVFETLCRGQGDLSDAGFRHMYALSPWIESRASVSMERAPRIGARGQRIVKTHFPTSLCPYSESARYVYVTRHPLTCFASAVDFVRLLSGPLAPPLPKLVDWFCSDEMWWRSWPEHVDGWWRWAGERPNVLFLHYEHMLDDLGAAVDRVSAFLDVKLLPDERAEVVRKSGYDYMKRHEDVFEMSPPSFLTSSGYSFFQSGRRDRDRTIPESDRERIKAFCRERLADSPYPLARFYPDVAAG